MAFVDNVELLLEKISYSFALCQENSLSRRIFSDGSDLANRAISAGNPEEQDSDASLGYDSSASEEDLFGQLGNKSKKGVKTNPPKCKFVHWKDTVESPSAEEARRDMILPVEPRKWGVCAHSKLSNFVQNLIRAESNFISFSRFGTDLNTASEPSLLRFRVGLHLELKTNASFFKDVAVEALATVAQTIGYVLYLCEVEDFRTNLKLGLDNYKLYARNAGESGPARLTALDHKKPVHEALGKELLLKYDPAEIVAKIVFSTKTSTAYHESQPYCLSLNFHLRDALVRYLNSRKLRIDGGFDVYVYPNKTYISDLDVPMSNFKDYIDEENKLCFDIVYYDNKKAADVKQRNEDSCTFDLYKRASLQLRFKGSVEVNVGVDGSKIEIVPVSGAKGLFNKVKPILIEVRQLKGCSIVNIKSDSRKQLKIKYDEKDVARNVVVEAPYYVVQEMNQKINDIITDRNDKVKKDTLLFQ